MEYRAPSPNSLLDETLWENWDIYHYEEVGSTNDLAREMPPWSAVYANRQASGRGRHGREWLSDDGGLWLSLVLPADGDPSRWSALPLGIGCALMQTIRSLGDVPARLKWPNDIMIDTRKLAGILLERFATQRVIIGIGMNITNNPEENDPSLSGITCRLADYMHPAPLPSQLVAPILERIRAIHARMDKAGFAAIQAEVNRLWNVGIHVEIVMGAQTLYGNFQGVNAQGDPILKRSDGHTEVLTGAHVRRLRENPPPAATLALKSKPTRLAKILTS